MQIYQKFNKGRRQDELKNSYFYVEKTSYLNTRLMRKIEKSQNQADTIAFAIGIILVVILILIYLL